MTELDIRKAICEAGRRLYAKNLVAATDGNLSARIGPDRYVCTPSGVSKGYMNPRDLVIADGKGHKLAGEGKVTSEFSTHLAAYEERPEMSAVIHAHPPKAIGFTLAACPWQTVCFRRWCTRLAACRPRNTPLQRLQKAGKPFAS